MIKFNKLSQKRLNRYLTLQLKEKCKNSKDILSTFFYWTDINNYNICLLYSHVQDFGKYLVK